MLAKERPTLCFACCEWLVMPLLECGVDKKNIYVMEIGKKYNCGIVSLSPFKLYHDIDTPNCGWRIYTGDEKALYATDTSTMKGIVAKDYNLYLLESNYSEDEIQERIREKQENGQYCYEERVIKTHLSHEQASEWLMENMSFHSEYVFLHGHKDKKKPQEWEYADT